MEKEQSELAYETQKLAQTVALAEVCLAQARRSKESKLEEIAKARKEMRENAAHQILGYYSADDFENLVTLSQYTNPIFEQTALAEASENKIVLLERLVQSPYFARIDFLFDAESSPEQVYIGRSTLMDDRTYEIVVYDWRSPIASVFYRFTTGPAYYDAPAGRVSGEVRLKRQYEITGGKLEYYFDADVRILDEFLRKMLSQNTSSAMKTIVETIQREQDIAVRDMEHDVLMIQGAAGSGKTSVALHRAAYLMYQGLSSRLAAGSILILSPNLLFKQYISNVLPELGEENTDSAILEDLLSSILENRRIQSRNHFLERILTNALDSTLMKSALSWKTSRQFADILDRFIEDVPHRWIRFTAIYYGQECIADAAELKRQLLSGMQGASLGLRLKRLEESLLESAKILHQSRRDSAAFADVRQKIADFIEPDAAYLYEQLFSDEGYLRQLADQAGSGALPGNIDAIVRSTRGRLQSYALPYDDASALAYLKLKLYGTDKYRSIKHVLIDEAQDYYPLHFEIFNILFPQAKYTILGDINQTVEKKESLTFYAQIEGILHKAKTSLVTLDKSFRPTNEILEFSRRFLPREAYIHSFSRSGREPEIHESPTRQDLIEKIVACVKGCLDEGYQSVGLVCKSEKNALSLYRDIQSELDVRFVRMESSADLRGVILLPVYLSKGLEFDAVLICDADQENYSTQEDRGALYIACTRALHRLDVFCKGTASPLLTP